MAYRRDWETISENLHKWMRHNHSSVAQLARMALIDDKTVRRLLDACPVQENTLAKIEGAIASNLGDVIEVEKIAAEKYGRYVLSNYIDYVDSYHCYKKYWNAENKLIVSQIHIKWNDEESCLTYEEIRNNEYEYRHHVSGHIFIRPESGHIQLQASQMGNVELAILNPLKRRGDDTAFMTGISTSTRSMSNSGYQIVTTRIVLDKDDFLTVENIGIFDETEIDSRILQEIK